MDEIMQILQKLKTGKASGHDNIPPEFWKYVLDDVGATLELVGLCNKCWREKCVPQSWKSKKIPYCLKAIVHYVRITGLLRCCQLGTKFLHHCSINDYLIQERMT